MKAHHEVKEWEGHLTQWQAQRDGIAACLETAQTFHGEATDGVMLKAGESVFFTVTDASLIEERRGQGHYEGHSQGFSIPVASIGGRSVRYRVGASKGHYVPGTPSPTEIDHGTIYVTNLRVIFQGAAQTRECAFDNLIGFRHDDGAGTTTFSVSNRSKPTTVHYGPKLSTDFDFRLELAIAHFQNKVTELVAQLQSDLDHLDANKPLPPPPLPPA